jgi:hypothetical protein
LVDYLAKIVITLNLSDAQFQYFRHSRKYTFVDVVKNAFKNEGIKIKTIKIFGTTSKNIND